MLTREDDIDVHALRRQGWTISLPRAWDHLEVLVSIADLALGFKGGAPVVGVQRAEGEVVEDEDLHPGEAARLDIVPRWRLRCDERESVDGPCRMRSRARSSPRSVSLHRALCLSNQRLVLDSSGGGERSRRCRRRTRRC
jgi:hypothetical protein